jgi:hypothetical protein
MVRHWAKMSKEFPSRVLDKVILRLPDGMRDRLAEAATANNRSMNAEAVSRLEKSFDADQKQLIGEIGRLRPDGTHFIDEVALAELVDKRLLDFQEKLFDALEKRFDASKRSPGILKSPKA